VSQYLPIAAVAALVAAASLTRGRRGGSRAISMDRLEQLIAARRRATAEPQVAAQQQGRSTLLDDIVPVGESSAGYNSAHVSFGPVQGHAGSGPILLINLRELGGWGDTTRSGVIAPGYPSTMAKKRGSPYQMIRPTKPTGPSAQPDAKATRPLVFVAQEPGKASLYMSHSETPRLLVAAEEAAELLQGSTGGRDVEVLQSIALLFMLRRHEQWMKPDQNQIVADLDEAITGYIRNRQISPPDYLRSAEPPGRDADKHEDRFMKVESSFEESPLVIDLNLVAGKKAVPHIRDSIGAALKKNITSGWSDINVCPFLGGGKWRVEFVSNGHYAVRLDAAEWLSRRAASGAARTNPLDRPWTRCGEDGRPNLRDVIPEEVATQPLKIVGHGRTDAGDMVLMETRRGGRVVVNAKYLAICVARALREGWAVRFDSKGAPLDVVVVRALTPEGWEVEGVVMPVRVD
jgi:hypothetical protein